MRRGSTPDGRDPEYGNRVVCLFGSDKYAGKVLNTNAQAGKPTTKMFVTFDDGSRPQWINLDKGWAFEVPITASSEQV